MSSVVSRGTCSTTFPGFPLLFVFGILAFGSNLFGILHLHVLPFVGTTVWDGDPRVRAGTRKARLGMRCVSPW